MYLILQNVPGKEEQQIKILDQCQCCPLCARLPAAYLHFIFTCLVIAGSSGMRCEMYAYRKAKAKFHMKECHLKSVNISRLKKKKFTLSEQAYCPKVENVHFLMVGLLCLRLAKTISGVKIISPKSNENITKCVIVCWVTFTLNLY